MAIPITTPMLQLRNYFFSRTDTGMMLLLLVMWLSHVTVVHSSKHSLLPKCDVTEDVCEFSLLVESTISMMARVPGFEEEHRRPLLVYPNGSYAIRTNPVCDSIRPIDESDIGDTVTLDGSYKVILTVNNQMPGPPIVVYEGQQVAVNVTNSLLSEAITLHWHGQHQMGTPWMDGTGGVSQCPIQPGNTFTYRFIAHPAGSYWYHAHEGVQRSEGLFGPFIVLPRPGSTRHKGEVDYPPFADDFHVTIQDMYKESSIEVYHRWVMDAAMFYPEYDNTHQCYNARLNVDGYVSAYIAAQSVLINGKGWHYPVNTTTPTNPGLPLTTYHVTKGNYYRFRVINAALALTLKVSIDGHVLNVIATDGFGVTSEQVEAVVVAAGERYDFWIHATDSMETGRYWMRVEGLERTDKLGVPVLPIRAEAILSYTAQAADNPSSTTGQQLPANLPETSRRACTAAEQCTILNCPYRFYPPEEHTYCIPVTSLKPVIPEPPLTSVQQDDVIEKFLHFHYAGAHPPMNKLVATINSKQFRPAESPPQINPDGIMKHVCEFEEVCEQESCLCTHLLKVPAGRVVQLVLMVMAHPNNPFPSSHPIHMHGHTFQVVKIGYPEYDTNTGRVVAQNSDVTCADGMAHCTQPTWKNSSRGGTNMYFPDVGDNVVRKDTIAVPVGGYVVIRFETSNPGFWFLHCHMEYHNAQGMALIIQEGDVSQMPGAPDNLGKCGDFYWSEEQFAARSTIVYDKDSYLADKNSFHLYSVLGQLSSTGEGVLLTLGVTTTVLLIALVVCAVLILKLRAKSGYRMVPSTDHFNLLTGTDTPIQNHLD